MVFQDKKTCGIRICVDLWKSNDAFLHDPFPMPFTDDVLENVGGHKITHLLMDSLGITSLRLHTMKIIRQHL
jgi:hypothetical protein